MTKQISIIGCGWLGFPLAKQLLAAGYRIKGSTTSDEKLDNLRASGITPYYVEMTAEDLKGDIKTCLSGSDILILNIPPGLRKDPTLDFEKQMSLLIPYIDDASIKSVLYISSTSVFEDEPSIPIITEDFSPNATSDSGKQLIAVEHLFQNHRKFKTTVLRFAGLFGLDRHPAKYLSGKTGLKDPDAPVNLIHLDDCIGIIEVIINDTVWGGTFNASAEPHPSRQRYYTAVCERMGLPLPHFEKTDSSRGKQISSDYLLQRLNYTFKVRLNN